MQFELNEEQKLIQGTARRIAKERVAPVPLLHRDIGYTGRGSGHLPPLAPGFLGLF